MLSRQPNHVAALNLLTVALISQGRFSDAQRFIARAVQLAPSSDVSRYNYGTICKQLGKLDLALEHLGKALQLNATVPESWNNRGAVLSDLGATRRRCATSTRPSRSIRAIPMRSPTRRAC